MARIPSLTRFALQIVEAVWAGEPLAIRETPQSFACEQRPA